MKRYVLAHDLGTSGNKATLFDEDGVLVSSATVGYETHVFNGTWAEQNPADWWDSVCRSSREVLKNIDSKHLAAVAFSGQMMGCLCLDDKGRPLHHALIYSDQRSLKQEAQLIERIGLEEIYRITGHRPSASYSLEKLMWLRDHHKDIYDSTWKMVHAKDYLNYRLTGELYTDFSDASGTNAFSLENLAWSEDILEAAEIPVNLFPEAVSSKTIIGRVHGVASEQTDIPAGTPVVAGAGDGGCATLGAGSVSPGQAYCYMGSSSWVSLTAEEPVYAPDMSTFNWAHPIEGLYQPCGTMQTAGTSFGWLSGIMAEGAAPVSFEELNRMAEDSPPGANGVLFLPYLLGERSPWWNPAARAEFLGMGLKTTRNDLVRAVVEGIAMNLEISRSTIMGEDASPPIMFIGGGAQGEIWSQTFADVFGASIAVPNLLTEATSMGAALLGGIGTGVFESFNIVEKMNPVKEIFEPDSDRAAFYRELRSLFEQAYRTVEPLFKDLTETPNRLGTMQK